MMLWQQYLFAFCYLAIKSYLIDRQEIFLRETMNLKKSIHDKTLIDYFNAKCLYDEGHYE